MSQYARIKKNHPDAILFFRLGDFYEMFHDDAKTASKVLGIALTSRDRTKKNPVPLCGVPFHSAEPYISRLLDNGNKVAICEQVSDPKETKGLVERKVVRVLTPGVVLDSEKLESKSNNFLASVLADASGFSISVCDISTGEFRASSFDSQEDLLSELAHIDPKEILIQDFDVDLSWFKSFLAGGPRALVTKVDSWKWDPERCREVLEDGLGVLTLESFAAPEKSGCIIACGVIFDYLRETQMEFMPEMEFPKYYDTVDHMKVDEWTKRNLELQRSAEGSEKHSLLWVMDETSSPMGARLLRQWMNYPLLDVEKIAQRQKNVAELLASASERKRLVKILGRIGDIERLVHRISSPSAKPRDLASLRDSSFHVEELRDIVATFGSPGFKLLAEGMDDFRDVRDFLSRAIVDSPPVSAREGNIVREGFDPELDRLRKIQIQGKKWISELEANEREKTGIRNLKVGYNKVFGYYLEVTKSRLSLVPDDYVRRQTLTGSERFISPELKEYEEKIVNAREKTLELEASLFERIRAEVAAETERIRKTAAAVARVDVFAALAEIADRYGYSQPEFVSGSRVELRDCRHPVVERMSLESGFVPNDIELDSLENRFLVITGPNMSGKSTLIRQVALICLMAQMGSFVPARSARLGVIDRIFSRVGASDKLARGQSTFMVEMVETAYILRNATEKSLVILDEIGRGTSTFDGMSIAWAVSEYLHDLGPMTLFATHYHELSKLADTKKGIQNCNVMVKESNGEIVFLRKLLPGSTSHSYGIHVARLAGVPATVLDSARKVLFSLEKLQESLSRSITGEQLFLFDSDPEDDRREDVELENLLADDISALDPMSMTPMEALQKLIELKDKASRSEK